MVTIKLHLSLVRQYGPSIRHAIRIPGVAINIELAMSPLASIKKAVEHEHRDRVQVQLMQEVQAFR